MWLLGVPLGIAILAIASMSWLLWRRPRRVGHERMAAKAVGQTPGPSEQPVIRSEISEMGHEVNERQLPNVVELPTS